MPPFIYKGFARGARTLVNLDETCNHGGSVGMPTGGGIVPMELKELPKVAKNLKLSGALGDKLGKLKVEDNKAREKKLRDLSPIKFSIHDKPKN